MNVPKFRDRITPEKCIAVAAAAYSVTPDAILSHSRKKALIEPRFAAMWLTYNLTRCGYQATAEVFKRFDHTSAMYAVKKAPEYCGQDRLDILAKFIKDPIDEDKSTA